MNHPPAEIQIDAGTVGQLLAAQCPEFAGRRLRLVDQGWDNFIFLLGEGHSVRLPRRELAVSLLLNEQRWLPQLANRLPLEIPVPVFAGRASELFRWPWSVVRWVSGTSAEAHRFSQRDAVLLAQTLLALHRPAPDDAPPNPYRGVPLATRIEPFHQRLAQLQDHPGVDAARLAIIFAAGCAAPPSQERVWLHGDLHARNVVVRDNRLVGLIDWGDLTAGDAASDLASAWLLIDAADCRRLFLETYHPSEALACRAKGWAVHLALALVASGEPRHVIMGLAALGRIIDDS